MPDSLPTINKDSLVHLSTIFFFLNFRLYLFASEVHSLTGVSPCHCDQVRVTGHRLSSLIVKFLIFIFFFFFFSGLGIVSYHSFLKTTYFSSSISDCTCNQLDHPHYLSTYSKSHFWPLSKVLFPEFEFSSLLGNYIWLLNFLVNPSCTAIDKYCHIRFAILFRLIYSFFND